MDMSEGTTDSGGPYMQFLGFKIVVGDSIAVEFGIVSLVLVDTSFEWA